jgi:ATP-dependent RNA helicase DeaD
MPLKAELIEALSRVGFTSATDVQERAIPSVLSGKDAIVRAKTGTGKTAAFIVPIMQSIQHSNAVNAIIIVPTRELALQVAEFSDKLGRYTHLRTTTVYGGASINVQISALQRGVNIVVGTPGRIIDLIDRGVLRLDNVRFVVLDEADRMLDMGFIDDIDYILTKTPMKKQMLLFSATMPQQIIGIARRHMEPDFETILVGKEDEPVVTTISHSYTYAKGRQKFAALLAYIAEFAPRKCIIFSRTKYESDIIHEILVSQGLNAILLHGGLTQAKREHSLDSFKRGVQFMVATNIAARGLDIDNVTDIINFDAPETAHDYIHRVGRSARMGKEGRAFTIFGLDERRLLQDIEYEANIRMKELRLNVDKYNNFHMPEHRSHHFGGNGSMGGGRGRFRPRRGNSSYRENNYGGGYRHQSNRY